MMTVILIITVLINLTIMGKSEMTILDKNVQQILVVTYYKSI
jgi:hypothetical protein